MQRHLLNIVVSAGAKWLPKLDFNFVILTCSIYIENRGARRISNHANIQKDASMSKAHVQDRDLNTKQNARKIKKLFR
ncbi:unnamed protein product [Acanthoscelides obtectus]|uniref:Uncharacterized protein n=1 Tax=Acanthoscelides obtectus TaxID=200917 RepID=A0A9P0QDG0_ACAOB|nr:unnamed protein product [Acanthoscelides obtectus]CAK1685377.1 hypothetical protein AOBTE_LOCUS35358 [Acanthoscelides obtectus]